MRRTRSEKQMKGLIFVIPMLFLVLMTHLWAASKKAGTGETKTSGSDVTKEVAVENIISPEQEYHYISMAKPNPFIPPLVSSLMARLEIPIENSLQKFNLQDLKVVGIWTLRNTERKAMILTPTNEGVVVIIGSLLGRRGGKVTEIDDSSITVREFSLASDGTRQFEEAKIWIEEGEPQVEDKIIMHSDKIGSPNQFGYGSKNYSNQATYEERHQDILKRLDEQQYENIRSDDGRPSFKTEQAPSESLQSKSMNAQPNVNMNSAPSSTNSNPTDNFMLNSIPKAESPEAVSPAVTPSPQGTAPSVPEGTKQ